MKVLTGLDILSKNTNLQKKFKGTIALLCNNASIDTDYTPAALKFKEMFGDRFIKLFGPQHGFSTDAQDNMIETDHFIHPYLKIPVYSLYSETRIPTDEMLNGINHFFVDLQDIGARMYTYIYSLTLLLEKCSDKNIDIVILDRPNPLNGITLEGNILDLKFSSFIGRHPMPVRHGLTIGEVALMHQKYWSNSSATMEIIKMENWNRSMYYEDTKLPWLLPSPNIARVESTFTFPATVFFEGTNLSEGRGTTQPLEIFGHPKIDSFYFFEKHLKTVVKNSKLEGFSVRPINFLPTFHKHQDSLCGGFQIHVTDKQKFKPWRVGQLMLREMYHYLGEDFQWLNPPYEYNYTQMPIDIINGTDVLRHWVEKKGHLETLIQLENLESYIVQSNTVKLYS
jgi:uncharacterized protein YbbC (DUF1343 family)